MRKSLVLLFLICSACNDLPPEVRNAQKFCASHGGVKMYQSLTGTYFCKDHTSITTNRVGG